ncbi:hypothetical protein FACS1894132_08130 [Clostridia bacterium]|nr:hypothetical protein FACS1894132_08130 [Clostridia bacterium]
MRTLLVTKKKQAADTRRFIMKGYEIMTTLSDYHIVYHADYRANTDYRLNKEAKRSAQFEDTRERICDNCLYCTGGKKLSCIKTAYENTRSYYDSKATMPKDRFVEWNGTCKNYKDSILNS